MAATALFVWPILGLLIFAVLGPVRGLIWSVAIGAIFAPLAVWKYSRTSKS